MINKLCIGEFSGGRLYTGLRLDYRLIGLWAPTPASRAISAVAELLVYEIMLYRRSFL